MIVVDFWVTTEDPKVRILIFVGFFCLQFVIVGVDFEIVEQNDVTDFDMECKILFMIAPKVDLKWIVLLTMIDNFKFLGVVPVVFVAIDVGAVNDESDGGEEFIVGFAFLVLFLELSE